LGGGADVRRLDRLYDCGGNGEIMSPTDQIQPGPVKEPSVRRRDWLLLPAVSLLTICFLAFSAEVLSRWLFPETQVGFQNCFATNDPTGDAAVNPDSVCWEQTPESTSKVEYRFNRRGHRAGAELSPKPPGTYRIVLIGSSLTQGLFVPREKTFAALLPTALSMDTGRKVEVYNEATGGKFRGGPYPTQDSAQHFDEVLAAQPDLILWVITPTDVMNFQSKQNTVSAGGGTLQQGSRPTITSAKPLPFWRKVIASIAKGTFGERLKARWEETRTSIALRHLLIASESQDDYIQSYLRNGVNANFLVTKPDAKWQMQLQSFDAELAEIAGLARNAGVPLVAVLVPSRPQAAMISKGDWPAGYDPFKLEDEVHTNIVSNGGHFIDILSDYRSIPGPERGYFPVDGHPDAYGHATIFRFLAKELTSGIVPELKASTPPDIAMEPAK
jgi:hypothetical protein